MKRFTYLRGLEDVRESVGGLSERTGFVSLLSAILSKTSVTIWLIKMWKLPSPEITQGNKRDTFNE